MKKLIISILTLMSITVVAQKGMIVDQKTGKISYDGIGKVSFVRGKVFRTKNGEKKSEELGIEFDILEKDIIQTESKSAVKIRMNDMTIITLGPNSHFNFKNFENNKGKRDASYKLSMGKARVKVPIKVNDGQLNFNTRTVSLGVRGTEFLMNQEIDNDGNLREQIALLEGKLEIIRKDGKNEEMVAGDHLVLKKDVKNNKINDQVIKLKPKVLSYLKAEGVSNQSIKPFLVNLNDKLLESNSQDNTKGTKDGSSNLQKTKNFWQKSLQKLNNKLKQNDE